MDELGFGLELLAVFTAAIIGGFLARWSKLPVILGYLIAGIIIGPSGVGLIGETETIQVLADVGVVLLLFTLGLDFSLSELKKLGKVAFLGGAAQIILTALVGLALGKALGWELTQAIFFGFLIALSSTMVVLKTLMERGELDSTHGRVVLGILLIQDLSLVPLMIILPALGAGEAGQILPELGIAMLKAIAFILLVLVLGLWVVPRLLGRVASARSRELFLITIVSLSFLAALSATFFGVSAAVGAFIAGLFIGQSIYARQAFADIVPLRDLFSALFFVSLGMLTDLGFAMQNPALIILIVLVVIIFKAAISGVITWVFGYSLKVALLTGFGLIQIGEFSFVLAQTGLDSGIISHNIYSAVLVSAIITMLITPFALNFASHLYHRLIERDVVKKAIERGSKTIWDADKFKFHGHAVICGHGRVSGTLTKILDRRKLPYLVIEIDPVVISSLRARGVPCIYGDAANPEILKHTQLDRAKVLVCTYPDFTDVELTVRNALKINEKLDIVARAHRDTHAEFLKSLGVRELVLPEFEASLEVARHALHRLGLTSMEIQYILNNERNKNETTQGT